MPVCFALGGGYAAHAGPAPDPCDGGEGDGDCIPDQLDKCSMDSRNAIYSCDTDQDGYGNVCDPDFDQSFTVVASDFSMYFIPRFKSGNDSIPPPAVGADMDCSGSVISSDFSRYFVPKFKGLMGGAIPGPSGLPCAGTPGCN